MVSPPTRPPCKHRDKCEFCSDLCLIYEPDNQKPPAQKVGLDIVREAVAMLVEPIKK